MCSPEVSDLRMAKLARELFGEVSGDHRIQLGNEMHHGSLDGWVIQRVVTRME